MKRVSKKFYTYFGSVVLVGGICVRKIYFGAVKLCDGIKRLYILILDGRSIYVEVVDFFLRK